MNDDVGRKLMKRLKVMTESLLDEMSFFDAGGPDVSLQQISGGLRNDR